MNDREFVQMVERHGRWIIAAAIIATVAGTIAIILWSPAHG